MFPRIQTSFARKPRRKSQPRFTAAQPVGPIKIRVCLSCCAFKNPFAFRPLPRPPEANTHSAFDAATGRRALSGPLFPATFTRPPVSRNHTSTTHTPSRARLRPARPAVSRPNQTAAHVPPAAHRGLVHSVGTKAAFSTAISPARRLLIPFHLLGILLVHILPASCKHPRLSTDRPSTTTYCMSRPGTPHSHRATANRRALSPSPKERFFPLHPQQ